MADIEKIQPIGDTAQYELGARYLTTARTLTIGDTGKTFNGTADVSWSKNEILGASDSSAFYRGDKTWSNTLNGNFYANTIIATNTTSNGSQFGMRFSDKDNSIYGLMWTSRVANKGGFIAFRHYTENSSGALNGYMENFALPQPNSDRTSNVWYDILTTKNTITIAQGGTGATTAAGALSNLGAAAASHSHSYLPLSGGTMTGAAIGKSTSSSWIDGQRYTSGGWNLTDATNTGSYWPWARQTNTASAKWFSFGTLNTSFYLIGSATSRTANSYDYGLQFNIGNGYLQGAARVYSAVWNDYAEMRNIPNAQQEGWKDEDSSKPNSLAGKCVCELGDDTMQLTTQRLQKGCKIISDTYGFSIGETEDCKTPVAVSGRVLAYLLEGREAAKEHIGDFVCSGPDGTISIMTTEEYFKCPQAVVGTISAVPEYETWGTGNVKVDGRIWIYVR